MEQTYFNVIIGISGFLGSWVLSVIWTNIKKLEKTDELMVQELSNIKVLLVGQYVTRDSFDKSLSALFTKLDRIEDKLDNKADKS